MRSYGQYCGLAKALDVVGDRWTLLIVRELLIRPSCRYTDLQEGLPGIATNLLASRLHDLEAAGVVERHAPSQFRLTQRGRALQAAVEALGLWGAPLLADAAREDEYRAHWLLMPLTMLLRDRAPNAHPVTIELRTGGETMVVKSGNGGVQARMGSADKPDLVLTGHPRLLLGLLAGKLELAAAKDAGLSFQGDVTAIERFLPHPPARV